MKEIAQVAVVGAGPAGSTAAEFAASLGAEVVLVERKNEIGTPVQCGGFLPEPHELLSLMPRARLPPALVQIPERCILHRTRIQRIYPPSGKPKEFAVDGRVVDRRAFDRYLAYRAACAGAEILPATRAEVLQKGLKLTGRFAGILRPEVTIGADGPNSTIARSMGNALGEMGICLEYEMADVDIDPEAAEMYFSVRYAPGGYAWIIPLGQDVANVGVGIRSSYLGQAKIPQILDRFVRDHPIAGKGLRRGKVLAVMHGLVPASGTPGAISKGNMLLAGDAAGHVMATSGGGIPLAMVAGRIAGEVAAKFLKGEAALKDYEAGIHQEFGQELERSVYIRKLVDVIMRSDRLMDALFAALSADQMKAIMRARMPDALSRARDLLAGPE